MTPKDPIIVVFREGTGPWRWMLRVGFRHCFAVVKTPLGWVELDGLHHRINLSVLGDAGTPKQIADGYRARGMVAVITRVRRAPYRIAPWAAFTCVELVKRLIGLHNRVLTPWQLYRYLQKNP